MSLTEGHRRRSILLDLTPLRTSRDFRRLWLGLAASNIGHQVSVVAVGLQVYAITDSTLAVGMLAVFALVPLVVLGVYGGALVDAYDRRLVTLWSAVGVWVPALALAAQAIAGLSSVGLLYTIIAVQSAAAAINNPARSAIIPRLVPLRQLPAANALRTMSMSLSLTVGPLVGATMVALWGYAVTYLVEVATFTLVLYAAWRLPPIPPLGVAAARGRGVFSSIGDGLKFLGTSPNIRMTFLLDLACNILAHPRVFFPALAVVYLGGGEAVTGILTSALAVGALLATLLSGQLTSMRWQGKIIVTCALIWGVVLTLLGVVLVVVGPGRPGHIIVPALVVAVLLLAVAGGADAIGAIHRGTILQAASPDELRGRLQGVFIVVVTGGPRAGEGVGGVRAEWWGEAWALVTGGLACTLVVILLVVRHRRFLAYDAFDPRP